MTKDYYNHKERFAITVDTNGICFWHPAQKGQPVKIFSNKKGEKSVLASDGGRGWKDAGKAPYCEYKQVWFGEYPYGSYCWAIRRCTVTGDVNISEISTEINPSGLTECEKWVRDCMSYVPA